MERRDRSTRQRILDAAEKLFAEKGYKETTTREIVQEAGASLSSLQAHFQGKENAYYEVRSRSIEKLVQLMQPSLDEVEYLDRQGLLYGEMAWNLLSEIVSKYVEWSFDRESRHTIMLICREMMDELPVPDLPEDKLQPFFSVIRLLCERYTGAGGADWSVLVGRIVLHTTLAMAGDCHRNGRNERKFLKLTQSLEEAKYQVKSYQLLSLRAYLDIRKEGGHENGGGTDGQIQSNQAE